MKRTTFNHEFIEFIPSELEEGVLYVSVQYATAVHKCACGCNNKVVTPISPVDWQLLFDGVGRNGGNIHAARHKRPWPCLLYTSPSPRD